jgi:hypothetical protein
MEEAVMIFHVFYELAETLITVEKDNGIEIFEKAKRWPESAVGKLLGVRKTDLDPNLKTNLVYVQESNANKHHEASVTI